MLENIDYSAPFDSLIWLMLKRCANNVAWRENKKGVDTVLLKNCIEFSEESQTFNREDFREIYYLVYESFNKNINPETIRKTPFVEFGEHEAIYENQIWSLYFNKCLTLLINNYPEFPVCVMKIQTRQDIELEYNKSIQIITDFLNYKYGSNT